MEKYIILPLKNIFYFVKSGKLMFLLLVVSQIVSTMVIFLAFGMIQSTREESETASYNERRLDASARTGVSIKEARPVFEEIFKQLGNKIELICVDGIAEEYDCGIWMHFTYRNGSIIANTEWMDTIVAEQPNALGRLYTAEEFYNGERVIILGGGFEELETIRLGEESYQVIGHFNEGGYRGLEWKVLELPYWSAGDDLSVNGIGIRLKSIATISEYNFFAEKMFDLFDYEIEVPVPQKLANDTKNMYKTYIIIAAIMLGMSVINIGIVYGYVLRVRKHQNVVFSLCGAKKRNIFLINLIEMLVLCVGAFVIAYLIFEGLIFSVMAEIFEKFYGIYSVAVYLDILGMYLFSVVFVVGYHNWRDLKGGA